MIEITHKQLIELLHYDPDTGLFKWLKNSGRNYANVGKIAGTTAKNGYCCIRLKGKPYYAHRIAWLYVHGKEPEHYIDHINGIKTDNRICNLRQATHTQNARNSQKKVFNKSGFKGVHFFKQTSKWRASIMVDHKNISLGLYDTPERAHQAYCEAARKYHGDFSKT